KLQIGIECYRRRVGAPEPRTVAFICDLPAEADLQRGVHIHKGGRFRRIGSFVSGASERGAVGRWHDEEPCARQASARRRSRQYDRGRKQVHGLCPVGAPEIKAPLISGVGGMSARIRALPETDGGKSTPGKCV